MTVAHDPLPAAIARLEVCILSEKIRNLRLDRLRQQRTRALPENFGELVVKGSWLNQLEHVIVRHGISLLRWRSGGVRHPHDMPPFRFAPSPTFDHSSRLNDQIYWSSATVRRRSTPGTAVLNPIDRHSMRRAPLVVSIYSAPTANATKFLV